MKKKMAEEFSEDNLSIGELVETLIKSFMRTDSNYGMITEIKNDVDIFYNCITEYVTNQKLDIYALKLDKRILLSRTGFDFDETYEIVKMNSTLKLKRRTLELWDDEKSKILHLVIPPLKKHFPVEYSDEDERKEVMKNLISNDED